MPDTLNTAGGQIHPIGNNRIIQAIRNIVQFPPTKNTLNLQSNY